MASPNAELWKEAANIEMQELVRQGTWIEVPQSEATSKILPGTWVFRYKRRPDGTVMKCKGRYCARGDLHEGIFDTLAPIVAWSTIRMVFVFAIIMSWTMLTVNFSNAFVQAPLKEPIWIPVPQGYWSTKGNANNPICLRLIKSLHGLSVAPRLWYEHLVAALLDDGFKPTQDKFLFLKKDMIVFFYVDDCGICAPNMESIDNFAARM